MLTLDPQKEKIRRQIIGSYQNTFSDWSTFEESAKEKMLLELVAQTDIFTCVNLDAVLSTGMAGLQHSSNNRPRGILLFAGSTGAEQCHIKIIISENSMVFCKLETLYMKNLAFGGRGIGNIVEHDFLTPICREIVAGAWKSGDVVALEYYNDDNYMTGFIYTVKGRGH